MRKNRKCKSCGCTNSRACMGGCWWAMPHLCSACVSDVFDHRFKFKDGDAVTCSQSGRLIPLRNADQGPWLGVYVKGKLTTYGNYVLSPRNMTGSVRPHGPA